MSTVLGWLWNRLYDGVDFEHVEALNEIGDGAEIIYVPCHRSHMDYLLLSYVIYHKGFAAPHVAGGRESQSAGDRTIPAQGRRLLSAPHLQGRRPLRGGVRQVSGLHDGARPHAGIFHRGRTQPHRTPALAAHRHAVDDAARVSQGSEAPGGIHAGVLRLRAHRRRAHLHRRTVRPAEGKGERVRPDQGDPVGIAQQARPGARQSGPAHCARRAAVAAQSGLAAQRYCRRRVAGGMAAATPLRIWRRRSTSKSTRPRR